MKVSSQIDSALQDVLGTLPVLLTNSWYLRSLLVFLLTLVFSSPSTMHFRDRGMYFH